MGNSIQLVFLFDEVVKLFLDKLNFMTIARSLLPWYYPIPFERKIQIGNFSDRDKGRRCPG